jgi:putative addiction module component (TIGR02574 family)
MSAAARKILDQALTLSDAEREELAQALSDSLTGTTVDVGVAWQTELARRLEAAERGEARLVSWDEVEARVRRRIA